MVIGSKYVNVLRDALQFTCNEVRWQNEIDVSGGNRIAGHRAVLGRPFILGEGHATCGFDGLKAERAIGSCS